MPCEWNSDIRAGRSWRGLWIGLFLCVAACAQAPAGLEKPDGTPAAPGAEAELGRAYFKAGNFGRAAPHLRRAFEQDSDDWESAQLLALSYYSLGDCRQALPLLKQLRGRLHSTGSDLPYLEGICYLKTEEWESARRAFAGMFSAPPDGALAHLMLAKMMVRQKMEGRAVPEIQKALELDPRLPMAHFLLGEIDLYQGKAPDALREFQKELDINPTVWLVYWRLGDAYARMEKFDEAENALKQSIWLNESFTGSYLLMGEIELKKGDLELAAGFLERALKLDPQNSYAHYALGRAYQRMGRTEEANRHFEITRTLRQTKTADQELTFQQTIRVP